MTILKHGGNSTISSQHLTLGELRILKWIRVHNVQVLNADQRQALDQAIEEKSHQAIYAAFVLGDVSELLEAKRDMTSRLTPRELLKVAVARLPEPMSGIGMHLLKRLGSPRDNF